MNPQPLGFGYGVDGGSIVKSTTLTIPTLFIMFKGYTPSASFLGMRNLIEFIPQFVTLQFLFLPKYTSYTFPFLVPKKSPLMVIGAPSAP